MSEFISLNAEKIQFKDSIFVGFSNSNHHKIKHFLCFFLSNSLFGLGNKSFNEF